MGPIVSSAPPSTGPVAQPVSIPGVGRVGRPMVSLNDVNFPFVVTFVGLGLAGSGVAISLARDVVVGTGSLTTKVAAVALSILATSFALAAAAGGVLMVAGTSPAVILAGISALLAGLSLYTACMRGLSALAHHSGRRPMGRLDPADREPLWRWRHENAPQRAPGIWRHENAPQGAPEIPRGIRTEGGEVLFRPRRADVRYNPRRTLQQLRRSILDGSWGTGCANSLRVQFEGEDGWDAGGLRRELWAMLGEGICRDRPDEKFLPALRADEGFVPHLGVVNMPNNPAEERRRRESARADYLALGEVMSWGARKGLRFPPVCLAPQVFHAMKAQLSGEFDRVGLLAIHGSLGVSACFPQGSRTDAQWEWLANQYYVLRDDAADYDTWAQEWVDLSLADKKLALQERGVLDRLRGLIQRDLQGASEAVAALIEGIGVDVGAQGLAALADRTPSELRNLFLGELSAATLLERVRCSDPNHQRWLRSWIQGANADQLQRFVRAVTGASTLGADEMIRVDIIAGEAIHAHSCGRSVEFPRQASEADFHGFLSGWVDVEGRGGERFNSN
jgi:hypothetical protein